MIHASACIKSLCRSMISPRCGEPASSSPSNKNLMLKEGFWFCARKASNAVRIPITPALSSEDERAYRRHSELISPLAGSVTIRSEEHTSELQSRFDLVCRLLLEKKKNNR